MERYYYLLKQRAITEIKKSDFLFELLKTVRNIVKRKGRPQEQQSVALASKASAHREKYANFIYLFKLKNYSSAARAAEELDFTKLSDREILNVIHCYLSSAKGVEGDLLLENLLKKFHEGNLNKKCISALADKILISGFTIEYKLSVLHDLLDASFKNYGSDQVNRIYIQWLLYKLESGAGYQSDPIKIVGEVDDSSWQELKSLNRFIPALKSHGYDSEVNELLQRQYDLSGFSDIETVRLFVMHRPSCFDYKNLKEIPPKAFDSVALLVSVASQRKLNPVLNAVFHECMSAQEGRFMSASDMEQDKTLRALMQIDEFEFARDLLKKRSPCNRVLSAFNLRGFHYFDLGDYHSARDCFLRVLREDPSDNWAASGLRLVLPRTGGAIRDILKIREGLGYGSKSSGRTGIKPIGSELTIAQLMSGEYVSGLRSKRTAPHWLKLGQRYGKKFLNYVELPEEASSKTLFVIGDEGVGDEIRTAQFYGELEQRFKKVTISCDPRLVNIFAKSFPRINFIPVKRLRKGVSELGPEDAPRLTGIDQKVESYLTEECRFHLESADYITFGQNLFFNRFAGNLSRPADGAYLRWSDCEPKDAEESRPLRVGLLWRSHFKSRMRNYMYLDLEEFAPILGIPNVEYWSIQHCIDQSEKEYCERNGIKLINDVDLFNDFEGMSKRLEELDLLIGISSVPIELGAAFGTEVWMLGFSPENYYLRTSGGKDETDQYTMNSKVLAPPGIDFSEPRDVCAREVFGHVQRKLDKRLKGANTH